VFREAKLEINLVLEASHQSGPKHGRHDRPLLATQSRRVREPDQDHVASVHPFSGTSSYSSMSCQTRLLTRLPRQSVKLLACPGAIIVRIFLEALVFLNAKQDERLLGRTASLGCLPPQASGKAQEHEGTRGQCEQGEREVTPSVSALANGPGAGACNKVSASRWKSFNSCCCCTDNLVWFS
jgi:hypothetical protein